MSHSLTRYLDWFHYYVREFRQGTDEDVASIELKKDHSLRVLQEAKMITASLEIESWLADMVHIAALLHDVGRFPQYRQFKTFNDRQSVNHGRLGLEVIRETGILDNLLPEHRKLVLGAVFLHNRAILPDRLSPALSIMVRIIRDADKLDIIPTIISNLNPAAPASRVVSMGLSLDCRYSEDIYRKVALREFVDTSEMVWLNDYKLILLGWLPTLNFPASRRAVLERRYPERLLAILPLRTELTALGEAIRSHLLIGI